MKWISVKERLPEEYVPVLAFGIYSMSGDQRSDEPIISLVEYKGKNKDYWPQEYDAFGLIKVTHWMPLPDKPKIDE